jgi:hypothetical protein
MLKPKKKIKDTSSMYNFQNIHTGSSSTDPGVLKAQADKKKRDAAALAYKKKTTKLKLGGLVKKKK